MAKLTEKQRLFCKEYLIDLNATQAAIRAGYSKKTARQVGCENLTKPYINEYIQKQLHKHTDKVDITVEDVLKDIKDTRDTCKDIMLYTDEYGTTKVDVSALNGRIKSNDQLGKYLKMFTDRQEIEHKGQQITIVNDLGGNNED